MSKGKRIGYIRVSTLQQNPDRQLEGIQIDKKFIDYCCGFSVARPQLNAMLDFVREDDIVLVHSMDRLGRVLKDILNLVDDLLKQGIQVHFLKENLIFTSKDDPLSKCILHILASVAEFEYSLIKERQAEGIALAKKAGRYLGRSRKLGDAQMEIIRAEMQTRKSVSQIAAGLDVSRATIYRYLKQMKV